MTGVRRHERERLVTGASLALTDAVLEWRRSEEVKDLTMPELLSVMQSVLGDQISGELKYAIRFERHGNFDTPGGFAADDDEDDPEDGDD